VENDWYDTNISQRKESVVLFSSEQGIAWKTHHAILSSDEKHSFSSNMDKWAGINLSVIPSDGKPTPYWLRLHEVQ
jgi:hypothetical protein